MSSLNSLIIPTQEVDEKNTCQVTATLKTPTGVVVPVASITSAVLNLRNNTTGLGINTADRNVISYFSALGVFTYVLTSADNAIISTDTTIAYEDHTVTLNVVFTSGSETHTLIKNIRVRIRNLSYLI